MAFIDLAALFNDDVVNNSGTPTMANYHALTNAIIMQAIEDYANAYLYLKRREGKEMPKKACDRRRVLDAERDVKEIETFFLSDYMQGITDVNGVALLEGLKKQLDAGERRRP